MSECALRAAGVSAAEVGRLFSSLSPALERIVRADVCASEPVIEDACQSAWSRLVHHADRIERDRALRWLRVTAVHEAFRLHARDLRELSLEGFGIGPDGARGADHDDDELDWPAQEECSDPYQLAEHRERLWRLRALPERQRRAVWMHALGFSYEEIAARTGCTRRTVDRQLTRARQRMREL